MLVSLKGRFLYASTYTFGSVAHLAGNRAVSTNLYFREKNFRIIMMRKFRLAEPVHLMCWVENFSLLAQENFGLQNLCTLCAGWKIFLAAKVLRE